VTAYAESKGDCTLCGKAVYGNSDPYNCNSIFYQDPYGPEGEGTYTHMSCTRNQKFEARWARDRHREEIRTLTFMLFLLFATLVVTHILRSFA